MTTTKSTTGANRASAPLTGDTMPTRSSTTTCERGDSNPQAFRRQILSLPTLRAEDNGAGQHGAGKDRSAPERAERVRPKVRQAGRYDILIDGERFTPRFLVYGLVDPREPERIRYVGQTAKGALHRYVHHILSARTGNGRKRTDWLSALLDAGYHPLMVLLERTTKSELADCERRWIIAMQAIGQADCNAPASRADLQPQRERRHAWMMMNDPHYRARKLAEEDESRPASRQWGAGV